MDVVGLVPLLVPVALIVVVAAVMIVRARNTRGGADVVLDLCDVPTVRLAGEKQARVPEDLRRWETTGELVSAGAGSLGARMQHAADIELRAVHDHEPDDHRPGHRPGHGPEDGPEDGPRQTSAPRLVVRRRRRPLVAVRR